MTKKISARQQAKNAIQWIERLPRFRKTRATLQDETGRCCLGVAAHLQGIPCKGKNEEAAYKKLPPLFGLNGTLGELSDECKIDGYISTSLARVNDVAFSTDKYHKRTAAFIRSNIDKVFKPEVAKLVAAYFAKKS